MLRTKKTFTLLSLCAAVILISLGSFVFPGKSSDKKEKNEISWISFEEAVKLNSKQPKKIVIDVYTDWCGWCKKMDKSTFSDANVVKYINENYYAVKLDAEGKTPINFKGQTFNFKPEYKSHELAIALLQGKMSYPTTVYMDEKMNLIQAVPGYMDAATFEQVVNYFGGDHYKKTSWEDYQKNFVRKK
jgi:thioredoxin-related protein